MPASNRYGMPVLARIWHGDLLVPNRSGTAHRNAPGSFRSAPGHRPAVPQAGQGEPVGQPPAAIPHQQPVAAALAGQANRVAGDLSGAGLAEPQPHQHPGLPQPGEEPRLITRLLHRPVTTFRSTARATAAGRPLRGNSPGSGAGLAQRRRSFGKVKSAASFPPPYHTIPPSVAVCPGSPTAYPVTCPGCVVLYRWRTATPASARRVKNSCSVRAPAAAVHTSRRNLTCGGSPHPRRAVCSVSARDGQRAAVRSAGAVHLSPNRASASWHASRTR
jgi:hypothetical protein